VEHSLNSIQKKKIFERMHNVTADQIEKNKQLIKLVKNHPQIYNHDPATQQSSNESVEEIWAKIGQELQDTRKFHFAI
jgi:sulfur transfer protein SufE